MTMLDRMRRHKNWLKWSLALVVLTFVVFYIPDFLSTTDAVGGTAADRATVIAADHRPDSETRLADRARLGQESRSHRLDFV